MGPELVWNAVLEWPVIVLCTAIGIHWLLQWKRRSPGGRGGNSVRGHSAAMAIGDSSHLPRFLPLVAVLLPVMASMSAQESVSHRQLFTCFPAGVSYGALPWALHAAVAVALVIGNGAGMLGRAAGAIAVPTMAMVFLAPPGLGGGVPQLVALAIAAVSGFAAASTSGRPGASPLVGWWLVFAVASAMVLLSGFAKLAIVLGSLSAMAATLAVCAAALGRPVMGNGLAATLASAFVACVFLGCGYDESGFPRWTWALLAAAPAAMGVGSIPMVRARPRLRALAVSLAPATIAALALASAMLATGHSTDSTADPYAMAVRP